MNLQYTSRFTLTTAEIEIKTGDTPGDGTIPSDFRIGDLQICPDLVGVTYPAYWVCGLHGDAEWAKVESGPFWIDGPLANRVLKIKSDSGSITMNLWVRGE